MKAHFTFPILLLFYTGTLYCQEWSKLDNGLNEHVSVIVAHEGYIYAGGYFTNAGGDPDADYLARWDGDKWQAVGPGLTGPVSVIAFSGNNIYVGGTFSAAGNNPDANNIAYWDGSVWKALGPGLNKSVFAIAIEGNTVYAGGAFTRAGLDYEVIHVAYWDGSSWNAMGAGLSGDYFTGPVFALYADGGQVFAGGYFEDAGGDDEADYFAQWDGNDWMATGIHFDGGVFSIQSAGGYLYTSGEFSGGVARWNGNQLFNYHLSDLLAWNQISDLAIIGENIYAGTFDEGLYFWNGSEWELILSVGPVLPDDYVTVELVNDYLYVGGSFNIPIPHNIARMKLPFASSTEEETGIKKGALRVLPNPTNNFIKFTFGNDNGKLHAIHVCDAAGHMVLSKETTENVIDLSELEAGVYFLQIMDQTDYGITKIVKQ